MKFDQFSGQSFEQLIQAIALERFGSGICIFGSGADGGREATYKGKLPDFDAKNWDGYTLIQAKCKEQLLNDSRDAAWLCTQLTKELEKFVDNPQLERPDYYLLTTNITLSSVPETGGKAKIDKVFLKFKSVLGLSDWHVWSADELTTLLNNAPIIRKAFACWTTPSDVLSTMIETLVGPDIKTALPIILFKEMQADRDARLRDAGQETDKSIPLEKLFIDLPVYLPSTLELDKTREFYNNSDQVFDIEEVVDVSDLEEGTPLIGVEDSDFDDAYNHCVESIFRLSADKHDPVSVKALRRSRTTPLRNRVLVLGGPGQGKSTLGQFVAQLARARLLSEMPRTSIHDDISDQIDQIIEAARLLNIPCRGPTRIPIRIDLPMYADAISRPGCESMSVLAFIAQRYTSLSDHKVSVTHVRSLLKEFPWIVIFDGLDEVPPSSNRQGVVKAIEAFWFEVQSVNADVISFVTSRPQGYDNDLSPEYWQHWQLAPLSQRHALSYASKLSEIRIADPDRRNSIISDIEKASTDTTTQLLTTSPLQVTILFGISLLKGNIPQDRWELFDKYYSLLRDREAQKPGTTGDFIRTHKRTIDVLHQNCGWILQTEAEVEGRTRSYLTSQQFRDVITHLLHNDGHSPEASEKLADELSTITINRLVLLCASVEGQVSFDVRSLQEYMAAAKIFASRPGLVVERLRHIAASSHWRHVFRIAASKIFSLADLDYLRTEVVGVRTRLVQNRTLRSNERGTCSYANFKRCCHIR
ncbi:hypothetical protein EDF68_1171, partial [Ochrobactrum sp. BH3]